MKTDYKNTMPDGQPVTARYVSVVCVCKLCMKSCGRLQCNLLFVGPGDYDGMDS